MVIGKIPAIMLMIESKSEKMRLEAAFPMMLSPLYALSESKGHLFSRKDILPNSVPRSDFLWSR